MTVLSDTGGSAWVARSRLLSGLVVAAALLLVSSCAATPTVLAVPQVAGGVALSPPQTPLVLVDWEYWLPWTPSQEHATYSLALSCSSGQSLGQFREAIHLGQDSAMPSGNVGSLGRTGVSCDNWRTVYFGHRTRAGLPEQPSASWDWLDVQATVNADGTVDVVEKHRVIFTYGNHRSLVWRLTPPPGATSVSNLEVWEGEQRYPLESEGEDLPRRARLTLDGGQYVVTWWFPDVVSPTERTFTIRYRVDLGADASGLPQRLELPIIAASRAEAVWRGTVSLQMPPDFPLQRAVLGSIGAPARHGLLNGQVLWFEARDVAPDVGWSIVIEVPGVPTATAEPTATTEATPTATTEPTVTPTATATLTPTPTPTPAAAVAAANTPAPTPPPPTPTTSPPTATATAPPTSTPTLVPTATATPRPTDTVAPTLTATVPPPPPPPPPPPTSTPTLAPTATSVPTFTPTVTATPTATATPTITATPTATATPVCDPDDVMTFIPPDPLVEEDFTVRVTSSRRYEDGTFSLVGENITQGFQPTQDGTWIYDWEAHAATPGVKQYDFVVSGQVCASNSVEVMEFSN